MPRLNNSYLKDPSFDRDLTYNVTSNIMCSVHSDLTFQLCYQCLSEYDRMVEFVKESYFNSFPSSRTDNIIYYGKRIYRFMSKE